MIIPAVEASQLECHKSALTEKTTCPYANSPFRVYKEMSSKKKGAYFERIVAEYLVKQGHKVTKAVKTSDYDRLIDGRIKLEIKGSMLWGAGTNFRWQQIRTNQDYDVVCFLAMYPDRIELYGATKQLVMRKLHVQDEAGNWIFNQHGGMKVNSGTFFMDGMPEDYPWLKPLKRLL